MLIVPYQAPESTWDKRLSMKFEADSFIKVRGETTPVYFGTINVPAVVKGEAILEIDEECEGATFLEINYTVSAGLNGTKDPQFAVRFNQEKVYKKKLWTLDLDPKRIGKIGPGTYRRSVTAAIDSLWPSSFDQIAPNGTRMCWIRYHFHTKLCCNVKGMGDRVTLEKTFEVWVLNSLDSSPMPPPSSKLLYQKLTTKKSGLTISLSIPSEGRVEIGQVLPVTLRVPPFEKNKFRGQAPIVTECVFKLREEAVGKTKPALGFTTRMPKDIYTLPLQTNDWPRDGYNGLERVISMSLPGYPAMSASATTQWLDVSYILEVSLKIRAEGQKEREAEVLKGQFELDVVTPRHVVAPHGDQLPAYE